MTRTLSVMLLALLIAAVAFIIVGRRWRIRWAEIAVLLVLFFICIFSIPMLLSGVTDGRAAPVETFPWTVLLSFITAFGWLFYRRRSDGRSTHPAGAKAKASSQEHKPASPGKVTPAPGHLPQRTIFISYRRSDTTDITGRIYDRFVQRFGTERVFKDVDTIPLGVDFRQHLDDMVGRCDALIAVIGRDWLTTAGAAGRRLDDPRDLVRIEIAAALARGIPVIPILVGGAVIPDEDDLPAELRDLAFRQGIPVRPDPDFHKDVDRLIKGLEAHFRD